MAIVFAVRGDQFNARYAPSGAQATLLGATAPLLASSADPAVFGGAYIDMTHASALRAISYPGFNNTPNNGTFSILMRIIPRYSGTPVTTNQILLSMNGPGSTTPYGMELSHSASTGVLNLRYQANSGSATNYTSTGVFAPVSGTPVDIMVTWDGTLTTGAMKWSVNGVELGTGSGSNNHNFADQSQYRPAITVGQGITSTASTWDLNELVIWNTQEPHVYATRTGFIAVDAFDGSINTDPGAATVLDGQTYYVNGVLTTGTLTPGSEVTAEEIADAVWNRAVASHQISGTFGEWINNRLITIAKLLGL